MFWVPPTTFWQLQLAYMSSMCNERSKVVHWVSVAEYTAANDIKRFHFSLSLSLRLNLLNDREQFVSFVWFRFDATSALTLRVRCVHKIYTLSFGTNEQNKNMRFQSTFHDIAKVTSLSLCAVMLLFLFASTSFSSHSSPLLSTPV